MKRFLDSILGASTRPYRQPLKGKNGSPSKGRRLQLESLENRRVFDVEFGSVIGIGNDESTSIVTDVAADAVGNRYVTGFFSGTVDFDPITIRAGDVDILMSRGTSDAYVAKYAPDDSLIWVRRMGGDSIQTEGGLNSPDCGNSIAVDANLNVYVTGTYAGSSDFGATTLTSAGDEDVFVAKLSGTGDFQWAKRWGGNTDDSAGGLTVDAAGNAYLAAHTDSTLAINILKLSANGNTVWSKQVVTNRGGGADVAVDTSGNVYVAGSFIGTTDFDPSSGKKLISAGSALYSGYVLKLSNQGSFVWVSPLLGGTSSAAAALTLDASNNLLVGGHYSGAVDFNPAAAVKTLSGRGDFVAKFTNAGGLVWTKGLERQGSSTGAFRDIAVDSAGSIYAAGVIRGSIDLDPGSGVALEASVGGTDAYLVKLNSAGAYLWSESFGGAGDDNVAMALDGANNIHLAGYFQYTVDFDAGAGESTLSAGNATYKGYLKKLRQI